MPCAPARMFYLYESIKAQGQLLLDSEPIKFFINYLRYKKNYLRYFSIVA